MALAKFVRSDQPRALLRGIYAALARIFRVSRHKIRVPTTMSVPNPDYSSSLQVSDTGESGADLRAKVQDQMLSESKRMEAISVLQLQPTHHTADLWEGLFSDPSAEVRTLAKSIVNDAKQNLQNKIDCTREKLQQTDNGDDAFRLYARLAELQWELVYQKLARADGQSTALDGVVQYAQQALELNEHEPQMWYLLGRCALLRGNADVAEGYFNRARACHFSTERLLPWLAEAAFLRRDYSRVQIILGAANRVCPVPTLQPVVHYWTQAGPPNLTYSPTPGLTH